MPVCESLSLEDFTTLVKDSQLNWFEIAEWFERMHGHQRPHIKESSQLINSLDITAKQKEQLSILFEAFLLDDQLNSWSQRDVSIIQWRDCHRK